MIDFIVTILVAVVIQAILAIGLNIQWGLAGLLDLSYIAFAALGAYIFSVMTLGPPTPPLTEYVLGLNAPTLIGLAAAMVAAGLLALVIGAVALRNLRADYFAIVTLCTAAILMQFVSQYQALFNGVEGVFGVPQPFAEQLNLDPTTYTYVFLAMCVVVLIVVYLFAERLQHSPMGRLLRATRDDELAAEAFGRNVYAAKLKAFVIGAVIAGVGGALLAAFIGAFNTGGWSVSETLLIYATVFVGGTSNNKGVMLGTLIIIGLFNGGTQLIPSIPGQPYLIAATRFIITGVLIVVALRFRPKGLIPERLRRDVVKS